MTSRTLRSHANPIRIVPFAVAMLTLLSCQRAYANRLLEFCDSADGYIASSHITSANATGWNDATIYAGDLIGFRYHIVVAIKDTLKFRNLFDHCDLDSAKLSLKVTAKSGSPGSLNFHFIKRDSTGMGVYPAYDDSRSYYCRTEWRARKGALSSVCPDSILWDIAGATGAGDYHAAPFAVLANPQTGTRYDVDVTPWVAGVTGGTDSVSNGILLLCANENGSGTDYLGVRNIWPFSTGDDRLILKVWISNWDWVKVRLDADHVSDGWITASNPDTIFSDDGYLKVGTGASAPFPNDVAVIFPDDSSLFGLDAIPPGYTVDSARMWLYATGNFPAPLDSLAAGEMLPSAAYVTGRFPTWDSAASGADWTSDSWSVADVVRRDAEYINAVNAWYSWSVGTMIQRWLDSASTRHGLALWETGSLSNRASAWIDRTGDGYGSQAGSLLVWITPPPPRTARRAWIDDPSALK